MVLPVFSLAKTIRNQLIGSRSIPRLCPYTTNGFNCLIYASIFLPQIVLELKITSKLL